MQQKKTDNTLEDPTPDPQPDSTPTVSLSEQTLITKTDNGYELSLNL